MKSLHWLLLPLLVACGSSSETGGASSLSGGGGAGGGSTASATTTTGSGGPVVCNGETCGADQFCSSFLWQCGAQEQNCLDSSPCTPSIQSVCGCDGAVYADNCAAHAAGVDLSGATICSAPAGTFSCGYTFCALGEEYCAEIYEGGWHCTPLPPDCQAQGATCECFGAGGGGASPGPDLPENCDECNEQGANLILQGCGPL